MNGSPEQLSEAYARVRERIAAACERAGRAPGSVELLAVSKTFEAERVLALAALGQRAFGENYVQEALAKTERCRTLGAGPGALSWHFIGPIQSNKTRQIATNFDWVHSVDRAKIATRLGEQRPLQLPPLNCCIQVNVSGEASKSGCEPGDALEVARAIVAQPRLRLRGVMAIPEPTDDESLQRRRFAAARQVLEALREALPEWRAEAPHGSSGVATPGVGASGVATPGIASPRAATLDTLSMGMSADLEAAIAEGATIVRVGSALFGERPRKTTA